MTGTTAKGLHIEQSNTCWVNSYREPGNPLNRQTFDSRKHISRADRTMNIFDQDPDNTEPSALVQAVVIILMGIAFAAVLMGYCH